MVAIKLKAVDLFCGAGGSSVGAKAAGVEIVAAVNHWPLAVVTHESNNRDTLHFCQDAGLLDPRTLPAFNLMIASPECRGHAHAKGKERPHHDNSRATAWCVVNVAEVCRPKYLVIENVPEFRKWALYPEWRASLEKLGYALTENVLDAARFKVPQNRVRLIITGSLGPAIPAIVQPNPRERAIGGVLDLRGGRWSPVKGHCANTLRRVANGRERFGESFVMPYYGSGSGETGRSLDRPIGTITTIDRWAIVRGEEMRMLTPTEYQQAMGFPRKYRIAGTRAEQIKQLGNAVCPPVMKAACTSIIEDSRS